MDDRNAKHAGAKNAGVYNWGCSCCMGNTRKGRRDTKRIARRAHRRYLKNLDREAVR